MSIWMRVAAKMRLRSTIMGSVAYPASVRPHKDTAWLPATSCKSHARLYALEGVQHSKSIGSTGTPQQITKHNTHTVHTTSVKEVGKHDKTCTAYSELSERIEQDVEPQKTKQVEEKAQTPESGAKSGVHGCYSGPVT